MKTLNDTEMQQMLLKKLKDKSFGKWEAYLLLVKSYQGTYGIFTAGLSYQYSIRNNQYPENVKYATYIMNNRRHDNHRSQGSNSHNFWNENQNTEQKSTDNIDDTILVITDTSFVQIREGKCYCCGK